MLKVHLPISSSNCPILRYKKNELIISWFSEMIWINFQTKYSKERQIVIKLRLSSSV